MSNASSVATGMVLGLLGGNVLLWRHTTNRHVFGRQWPVGVQWSALSGRDWLRLCVLMILAGVLMAVGLFTLPD